MLPKRFPCQAVALLATILLALPAVLGAQKAPAPSVLTTPDESIAWKVQGDQRVDLATGLPVALYRVGYEVDPASPEEMARQYLVENASTLGLRHTNLQDLVLHGVREGAYNTVVRFRQHLDGIPVYGAEITVTLDRDAVVNYVMNGYRSTAALANKVPGMGVETARGIAFDLLSPTGGMHFQREDLVAYVERSGSTRLAHRIVFSPRESPLGDWEVLVDAATGEAFRVADKAFYAPVDGTGTVFIPDPLSSAGATYGDSGYTDGSDADTPELNAELVSVTLQDIDLTAGTYSLTGPWAEMVDWDSPFKGTFSQASDTFNFNRFDDAFEAVNTYYHIDVYMRYMNETLGVTVEPYQYSTGVQFDAHGFSGADNSSYSTGTGRLRFGEGGVDDAEDADVIIHELGHAIHDWVTMGGLSQVNGLSEGVGDYVAQSYSRSFGQWDPADAAYHYVFSWDGHNSFWGGRITNYTAVYPGDLTGAIHTDGQIWATCMMQIWDAIGRETTDTIHLEGLAMTNSSSSQQDTAAAVLQAAVDRGLSGSDLTTITTILQGCGYAVTLPGIIFSDGFENGDILSWSASVGG